MKTVKFDVWPSGVTVRVPAGTDPDTVEGHAAIKAAAQKVLRERLDAGEFDIEVEPFDDGGDD